MYCPFCGTQLPDDAVFCGVCGRQVAQSQTQPAYSAVQQPQAQPVYGTIQQPLQETKKRSTLFGVFALIIALLYPFADLFWWLALYRLVTGEQKIIPGVLLGMVRYNLILIFLGIAGMLLIAIYYLALYPKRKGAALAAVGAILIALSRITFSMSAVTYTLGSVLTIVGAVLLAVYWFSNEKTASLGIMGPAFCIGAVFLTQLGDILVNGLAFGSLLFWAGLLMDLLYVAFWTIVLIANITGKGKKTA